MEEGRFAQPFDLHFQGFDRPVRFTLSGESRLPFPARIDLGPFDKRAVQEAKMYDAAVRAGFRVREVQCPDDRVRVSLLPGGVLHVESGDLPVGTRIDTFADVIFADGAPLSRQRVRISGTASGGLVVKPDQVSFGLTQVGARSITKEVVVTSVKDVPFSLDTLPISDSQLSVAVVHKAADKTVLRLTLSPHTRGALDDMVKVITPDQRRGVTVRCVGTVE